MDLATVMSIVQSLLATIQCCDQLFKDRSFSGYKSELESLRTTLNNVNAVLQDAEDKQDALSSQQKLYVEELRDAVYDADDVLDEFSTLVHRKKLIPDRRNLSGKVKFFLSQFSPIALNLTKKVKKVGEKLEGIASRKNLFSIDVNHQSIKFRKEDSCSYVHTVDIIGRGPDLEKIVDMLLPSDTERDVSCLSVVGMGGLGKTTLAQLVYNDERVTSAFPLKLWACVSDPDPNHLHLEPVLRKILAEATKSKKESSTYNDVQEQLRRELAEEKYLLVLDDVWNENHEEWKKLVGFLMGGQKGSWILVTTRSGVTAKIIGNGPTYNLQGLSEEDSWRLFENSAFDSTPTDDLVTIGKEIVKSCANVPLAIRAIGSLLYGQPLSKWQSFRTKGLTSISEDEHDIMAILKLSYYHLKPPLKSCFSSCAIFPKDCTLHKKTLIRLWMAQGYIIPEEGRHVEDVGEEYFLVLVRRCFFQNVQEYADVDVECKMHDLMHDIAQEVVGKEIRIMSGDTINEKVRHLGFQGSDLSKFSSEKTGLRTFLRVGITTLCEAFPVGVLLINCPCLRILDLSELGLKCLPKTIGKLLHLRWLNLSSNSELEVLPQAITKLYNLQILDLSSCKSLKEWPKDMIKLVNLRELDVSYCGLTYMPLGMCTSLHTLDQYGLRYADKSGKDVLEELEGLKPLNNLKGFLPIRIGVPENAIYSDTQGGEGGYLKLKQHLTDISINFKEGEGYGNREYEEILLDHLQPHPNLRELGLIGYHGGRMPRWPGEGVNPLSFYLPNLVRLQIRYCGELRSLSSLGRLPLLKHLILRNLAKVEFVEEDSEGEGFGGSTAEASFSYFPSLVEVESKYLPKLKGWLRTSSSSPPHLPLLNHFKIKGSEEFRKASIPCCPRLKSLYIGDYSRHVNVHNNSSGVSSASGHFASICELFNSMPTANFKRLHHLVIYEDNDMGSFGEMKVLFQSIQTLKIERRYNEVPFDGISNLDGIPWRHLPPTLHSLTFDNLYNMEKLPEGVQYCTSLHSLTIVMCRELKSLPIWMPNLTSLTTLQLTDCDKLKERCQKFTGEDWPLIQQIQNIQVS